MRGASWCLQQIGKLAVGSMIRGVRAELIPVIPGGTANRHTPRKRGIQYAAASRFNYMCLWNTGSPAFAGDDEPNCCACGRPELLRVRHSNSSFRPHDFAVRFSAVRYRHLSVHRIPPRVRDDREPPLMWDGTAGICEMIWVGREAKNFCKWGWTEKSKLR
jgi:hypothetical protein